MTTPPDAADGACLRLREPSDILGAVPYLLGFHPDECVVVVGLRRRQIHLTARADLSDLRHSSRRVLEVRDSIVAQDVTGVLVVGYGDEAALRPVLTTLRAGFERAGLVVLELLRAYEGRYWSYSCADPACCSPLGTPYDVSSSRIAAEATLAGLVTLPDRRSYEEQLAPVAGPARDRMQAATARATTRFLQALSEPPDEESALAAVVTSGSAALTAGLGAHRDGRSLSDDDVAWLSVLIDCQPVIDDALSRLETTTDVAAHRHLWLDVLRRAEPDLRAAPGSLFAIAAWRRGETTLAQLAVERVLDEEPTYAMARDLDRAFKRGQPLRFTRGWPVSSTVDRAGPAGRVSRRRGTRPSRRSSPRQAETPPA